MQGGLHVLPRPIPRRKQPINQAHAAEKRAGPRRLVAFGARQSRRSPTFPQSSIIGRRVLTSEFGMGSGISPCVNSPTNPSGRFHARTGFAETGWLPDKSGSKHRCARRNRDASDACGRRRSLSTAGTTRFLGVMFVDPVTGQEPWTGDGIRSTWPSDRPFVPLR